MPASTESHLDFYRRWHRLSKPYIQWQFEQFQPYLGQRIADVGCGLGNFTSHLLDRTLYLGIDLDEELLQELENRHTNCPNIRTARLDLLDPGFRDTLLVNSIDTILCVNVIEHIKQDRLAIRHIVEALPQGGHLCLLVPALPFLFGTLDDLDGHYRRYTRYSIARRFDGLPGSILKLYYFNMAAVPGWFLKGRILRQKTHTNDNYAIMNAVLPLMRFAEKLVSPPLGLSVIAIFRKT